MFVNLAYLLNRPTGTTSYALNLLPHLEELSPTYFSAPFPAPFPAPTLSTPTLSTLYPSAGNLSGGNLVPIPTNMTAADGIKGHLRRLGWTQFRLPQRLKKLDCSLERKKANRPVHSKSKKPLLFTPIPEAPLSLLGASPFYSVVTFHDLIPLRFPKEFGAIKYYFRHYVPRVLAQAEKVICNSKATARDIVDFYGIPSHKLVPIPLAYDAAHFRPTDTRPDFPPGLALEGRPYFLTLGRQAPYKNIGSVIAALAQVPDALLLIAGPTDPRYTLDLKKLAAERGMRSRVKFLSYVSYAQLPALLSHAIALVFPSLWEGFGLPVLEAMGCGTPVITSNVASLPEVAGDAAHLIDPYSLPELVAAMRAIATDASARQQLRDAGLKRVNAFSWEKTGAETVRVLQPFT